MKKHITYGVEPVDKISPLNNQCFAWVRWFDGFQIVEKSSGAFSEDEKAWEWIADVLQTCEEKPTILPKEE